MGIKTIILFLGLIFISLKLYNLNQVSSKIPNNSIKSFPWQSLNFGNSQGIKILIYLDNTLVLSTQVEEINQKQWSQKFFTIINNHYIVENIIVNGSIKIFLHHKNGHQNIYNEIPWPPKKISTFINQKKSSVIYHSI